MHGGRLDVLGPFEGAGRSVYKATEAAENRQHVEKGSLVQLKHRILSKERILGRWTRAMF